MVADYIDKALMIYARLREPPAVFDLKISSSQEGILEQYFQGRAGLSKLAFSRQV